MHNRGKNLYKGETEAHWRGGRGSRSLVGGTSGLWYLSAINTLWYSVFRKHSFILIIKQYTLWCVLNKAFYFWLFTLYALQDLEEIKIRGGNDGGFFCTCTFNIRKLLKDVKSKEPEGYQMTLIPIWRGALTIFQHGCDWIVLWSACTNSLDSRHMLEYLKSSRI